MPIHIDSFAATLNNSTNDMFDDIGKLHQMMRNLRHTFCAFLPILSRRYKVAAQDVSYEIVSTLFYILGLTTACSLCLIGRAFPNEAPSTALISSEEFASGRAMSVPCVPCVPCSPTADGGFSICFVRLVTLRP